MLNQLLTLCRKVQKLLIFCCSKKTRNFNENGNFDCAKSHDAVNEGERWVTAFIHNIDLLVTYATTPFFHPSSPGFWFSLFSTELELNFATLRTFVPSTRLLRMMQLWNLFAPAIFHLLRILLGNLSAKCNTRPNFFLPYLDFFFFSLNLFFPFKGFSPRKWPSRWFPFNCFYWELLRKFPERNQVNRWKLYAACTFSVKPAVFPFFPFHQSTECLAINRDFLSQFFSRI